MHSTKKASSKLFRSKGVDVRESTFQGNFIDRLRKRFHGIRVIIKEAGSIRGLPDIYGCYRGSHFELELKKNKEEASKNTGRIVLQKREIRKCQVAGGYGAFVYPENADKILDEMEAFFATRVVGEEVKAP